AGAVPGGVGDELASLIGTADLSFIAIVISMLIATGLGAIHAISPGHGKTVMAAYLVGTQGTARHAVVLGLTVTASHTLGAVAFGLGMAVVLSGIGLLVVRAGRLLDHAPSLGRLVRFAPAVPWISATAVMAAGIFLTSQALVQRF